MAYKKQTQHHKPAAPTSWDGVSDWYERWAGKDGSRHHQRLAIPAVLELLQPRPGQKILDIGAGTGVLAPHISAARAAYTGVDASPKLLDQARRNHAKCGRFILGDAAALTAVKGVDRESYDAAVFMLSLQDMDPLADVLRSAAWAIKPGGRVVLLLTHPCFRVPRQSGWGWDEGRKLQYRRVDRYLTPLAVPVRPLPGGQSGALRSFHRPLQDYVNGLADCGFVVDRIVEVPAHPEATRPRRGRSQRSGGAPEPVNREIPVFLGIRAQRRQGG